MAKELDPEMGELGLNEGEKVSLKRGSSLGRLQSDALHYMLGFLKSRDLLRLDYAMCNKGLRVTFLEALEHIDSGPLLSEFNHTCRRHSPSSWRFFYSWMCQRGIQAPVCLVLPENADDETMMVISKSSTLHLTKKVVAGDDCSISRIGMEVFSKFSGLREFIARGVQWKFTDSHMDCLAGLPIEKLDLFGAESLADTSLSRFMSLTALHSLDISQVLISDGGMEMLSGVSLRSLVFGTHLVTDTGFRALGAPNTPLSKTLKDLRINNLRRVTNEGIKALKGLTLLERIELWMLNNTSVTGVCFEHIACLQNLKILSFCLNQVSDDHLQPLSKCSRLTTLCIRYSSRMTGSGLWYLRDSPLLTDLSIGSSAFTAEGLSMLRYFPQIERFGFHPVGLQSDVTHIDELVNIKELIINGDQHTLTIGAVSDFCIGCLGRTLKKLESMKLHYCENISADVLIELAGTCPKLRALEIFYCREVSEHIMQIFRLKFPLVKLRFVPWQPLSEEDHSE